MDAARISVVIIARNEAEMIGDCVESAKTVSPDEILLFDDGSTDNTLQIAKKHGADVLTHLKHDFAEIRNFAVTKTKGTWLLYLDADERISHKLALEINATLSKPTQFDAFKLPRVNYYLGKPWPKQELITRLVRRHKVNWYGAVHETARVTGEIGELNQPLLHYTHRDLNEMVENTIKWSGIEAQLRYESKHPNISWWRIPRMMVPTFIDYYLKQRGWKVGTVGIIESIYQAFSIFITYARLWELQQGIIKAKNIKYKDIEE